MVAVSVKGYRRAIALGDAGFFPKVGDLALQIRLLGAARGLNLLCKSCQIYVTQRLRLEEFSNLSTYLSNAE